jgi:hypothetical protein
VWSRCRSGVSSAEAGPFPSLCVDLTTRFSADEGGVARSPVRTPSLVAYATCVGAIKAYLCMYLASWQLVEATPTTSRRLWLYFNGSTHLTSV